MRGFDGRVGFSLPAVLCIDFLNRFCGEEKGKPTPGEFTFGFPFNIQIPLSLRFSRDSENAGTVFLTLRGWSRKTVPSVE